MRGPRLVGEVLETVLSLHLALPGLPAVSALSANHLATLRLPAKLQRLYIATDADPPGLDAADELGVRARAAGIDVISLTPRLGDFNDDLRAFGLEDLRAYLRPQLTLDHVTAFLDAGSQ